MRSAGVAETQEIRRDRRTADFLLFSETPAKLSPALQHRMVKRIQRLEARDRGQKSVISAAVVSRLGGARTDGEIGRVRQSPRILCLCLHLADTSLKPFATWAKLPVEIAIYWLGCCSFPPR